MTDNRCSDGVSSKRDSALTLPEDLSPLELELTCIWKDIHYEIIGRIRYKYLEGYYRNQWLLANSKGQYKWLLEAYALYAIVDFEGEKIDYSLLKNQEPGNLIGLSNNQSYSLDAISEFKSYMIEGFTPVMLNNIKGVISLELSTTKFDWATIDIDQKQNALVYFGEIVDLKDLNFNKFRQLNG